MGHYSECDFVNCLLIAEVILDLGLLLIGQLLIGRLLMGRSLTSSPCFFSHGHSLIGQFLTWTFVHRTISHMNFALRTISHMDFLLMGQFLTWTFANWQLLKMNQRWQICLSGQVKINSTLNCGMTCTIVRVQSMLCSTKWG